MGRIISPLTVSNVLHPSKVLQFDALIDTGAAYLTLPLAWRENLGEFEISETVEIELANQSLVKGQLCGPARIKIEGCRTIFNEVLFVEMEPKEGFYEPLIGYLVLEQSGVAVDMIGHRLVQVKTVDLK